MLAVLPHGTIFGMTTQKLSFQTFVNTMFMAGALGLGGFIGTEFREMRQSIDRRFEQMNNEQRELNQKLVIIVEKVGQHDKSIDELRRDVKDISRIYTPRP